jgi:hypothetical protein
MNTHTRRCENATAKIVAMLDAIKGHPEFRMVDAVTRQLLNLATYRSQFGEEDAAKEIHASLRRALKKLAAGTSLEDATKSLSASAEALTPTPPPADAGGPNTKDK